MNQKYSFRFISGQLSFVDIKKKGPHKCCKYSCIYDALLDKSRNPILFLKGNGRQGLHAAKTFSKSSARYVCYRCRAAEAPLTPKPQLCHRWQHFLLEGSFTESISSYRLQVWKKSRSKKNPQSTSRFRKPRGSLFIMHFGLFLTQIH